MQFLKDGVQTVGFCYLIMNDFSTLFIITQYLLCCIHINLSYPISVLTYYFYVSPRQGRETYCFSPCVCPSVRHKSCPLYNLKTVKDFSMKLGTLVNQMRRCVMHKNHNSSLSIFGVISL